MSSRNENDPLSMLIEDGVLDCDDPSCTVCDLGALPGESRGDWLVRLTDRFACAPLPEIAGSNGALKVRYRITYVPCPVCGQQMRAGSACIGCVARGRGARRLVS